MTSDSNALDAVHEVRLDNGFRALLVRRPHLPLVASVVYYQVGARDERTGETGLSHFLEHMMFKGTDQYKVGEIDALTSKLGGSNNAFTDNDSTAYYFALASDRWHTALEIEASRMQSCSFEPSEFESEKRVVLEEMSMGEDDPWRRLWHATEGLAFQVHPYHHPVIGYHHDVAHSTPESMRAYYERNYGPNRAFLVAVGDLDVEETTAKIKELFGSLKPVEERAKLPPEPESRDERRSIIRFPGETPRLAMACRGAKMGEDDDFALDILGHILGNGRNARLVQRLVLKEQCATHAGTHNDARSEEGLFWITIECRPDRKAEECEAFARQELERIATEGPTQEEVDRARTQISSSFLFEDETALNHALKLGRFEANAVGGRGLIDTLLERYDAFTTEQLREVAARLFRPENWTVVWSLPEDSAVARPGDSRTEERQPA